MGRYPRKEPTLPDLGFAENDCIGLEPWQQTKRPSNRTSRIAFFSLPISQKAPETAREAAVSAAMAI